MKWVPIESGGSIEIISIERIDGFMATRSGEGLRCSVEGERHNVVTDGITPGSPAALLLAALNGPVGEVPYK